MQCYCNAGGARRMTKDEFYEAVAKLIYEYTLGADGCIVFYDGLRSIIVAVDNNEEKSFRDALHAWMRPVIETRIARIEAEKVTMIEQSVEDKLKRLYQEACEVVRNDKGYRDKIFWSHLGRKEGLIAALLEIGVPEEYFNAEIKPWRNPLL